MKLIIIAGSAVLLGGFFQLPTTPPAKLGLWETSSTTTMTMQGMNLPPRTSKVRSCTTAETWAANIGKPQGQDCTKTSETFSGHSYSADVSCSSGAKGHVTMTWDSPDSSHGTMHLDMNAHGQSVSMDMTTTAHFVSSDCGSVKPGTGVPVQ